MDWMTLTITSIGAVIFCLWVIIPIREYRMIYQRLRLRGDGQQNPHPDPPPEYRGRGAGGGA
jgi:hypothetical protein